MTNIFPGLTALEVEAATAAKWDKSGPLPLPLGEWLACPVCSNGTVQARFWKFHTRESPTNMPGRCDVSFKCCSCAAVWCHGVALDRETFKRMITGRNNRIEWREARQILEASKQ